jgi:diguanylate cyclase (GGDEF)-like protein/PAS domain S-box-containing protein
MRSSDDSSAAAGPGSHVSDLAPAAFMRLLDPVLITDVDTASVAAANPAACELFGLTVDELLAVDCDTLRDPDDLDGWTAALDERRRTGQFRGEVSWRRGDGTTFPTLTDCSLFQLDGHTYCVVVVRDLNDGVAHGRHLGDATADAELPAPVDHVTGLLSRSGFQMVGARVVAEAQRHEHPVVLLDAEVHDLDALDAASDHTAGEDVLRVVAAEITTEVRGADAIARTSGGEFLVMLAGARAPSDAAVLADRLERLERAGRPGRSTHPLTVTVGLAVGSSASPYSLDDLTRAAAASLFAAKRKRAARAPVFRDRTLDDRPGSEEPPPNVDFGFEARRMRKLADDALTVDGPPSVVGVDVDWVSSRAPLLTARDRELVQLLPTPMTFADMGRELGSSGGTVRTQVIGLYRRLGVASREEAIIRAYLLGLLDSPDPPGRSDA